MSIKRMISNVELKRTEIYLNISKELNIIGKREQMNRFKIGDLIWVSSPDVKHKVIDIKENSYVLKADYKKELNEVDKVVVEEHFRKVKQDDK